MNASFNGCVKLIAMHVKPEAVVMMVPWRCGVLYIIQHTTLSSGCLQILFDKECMSSNGSSADLHHDTLSNMLKPDCTVKHQELPICIAPTKVAKQSDQQLPRQVWTKLHLPCLRSEDMPEE